MIEPALTAWRAERRRHTLNIGRPPGPDLHEITNAVLYVDRTDVRWRCLPHVRDGRPGRGRSAHGGAGRDPDRQGVHSATRQHPHTASCTGTCLGTWPRGDPPRPNRRRTPPAEGWKWPS
ncbi:transposase [Streptomyces sp. 8K308]|nr:transposase [Streptomyces sp. 8K308]